MIADYDGRLIGSRIQSVEWCHFQRLCITPNSAVEGTPLFDVEYLRDTVYNKDIVTMEY